MTRAEALEALADHAIATNSKNDESRHMWQAVYEWVRDNTTPDDKETPMTTLNDAVLAEFAALHKEATMPRTNYEMYTDKGNRKVAQYVNVLIAEGVNGGFTRTELPEKVRMICKEIEASHGEVYDTEPRGDIADELNARLCGPLMWQPIARWEW